MNLLLRDRTNAGDGVFDPATVAILTAAFDDAWKFLHEGGITFASDARAEEARILIGKYIIEAAKRGERNQHRLRDDSLTHYAKSVVKHAAR
jgi:aspartate oxidase